MGNKSQLFVSHFSFFFFFFFDWGRMDRIPDFYSRLKKMFYWKEVLSIIFSENFISVLFFIGFLSCS